jgi:hypothetical protein
MKRALLPRLRPMFGQGVTTITIDRITLMRITATIALPFLTMAIAPMHCRFITARIMD